MRKTFERKKNYQQQKKERERDSHEIVENNEKIVNKVSKHQTARELEKNLIKKQKKRVKKIQTNNEKKIINSENFSF